MDALDPDGLTGPGEDADTNQGDGEGTVESRLEKLEKRLRDKDSFIEQLKVENKSLRDGQSRLQGSIETLATIGNAKKQDSKTDEPDILEALAQQVEDQEFIDSVDATPSKGLKLIVQALAKERAAIQATLRENWAALGGRDDALLERVQKELPLKREIAAYAEAIEELRKDPDMAGMSDVVLLKIAKKAGAQPTEDAQVIDGPSLVPRKTGDSPKVATAELKAQVFNMGLQLYFGDRAKAAKYVEKYLKSKGMK